MDRNNTSFIEDVRQSLSAWLKEIENGYNLSVDEKQLKYYQLLLRRYFGRYILADEPKINRPESDRKRSDDCSRNRERPKGMLISHTMGTGKSISASTIALMMLELAPNTKIVVMLLKSLQDNFITNIKKILEWKGIKDTSADKFIAEKFKFVAFNASNMISQLFGGNDVNNNLDPIETAENIVESADNLTIETGLVDAEILEDKIKADDKLAETSAQVVNAAVNDESETGLIKDSKMEKAEKKIKKQMISDLSAMIDGNVEKLVGDMMHSSGTLENTLVIVDEFHLLLRAITNGSKNGRAFYDAFMAAKTAKIIGLSGSVIAHDSFEIAVCYNLMAGSPIFPENWADFRKFFCDDIGALKDDVRWLFQNRIVGLTSYIGAEDLITAIEGTPITRSDIKVAVTMNDYQNALYQLARDKEREEKAYGQPEKLTNLTKPKSGASSSYKQRSRQLGNYAPPHYFIKAKLNAKENKQKRPNLDMLKDEDLVSAKYDAIYENLELPGTHIVYSQFVNVGGLGSFGQYLKKRGWKKYGQNISNDDSSPKYCMFTGEESSDERMAALKVFNSPENIDGHIIKCLMISSAGALGVDTKNCRYVHIMEPYWTEERMGQVRARAARLGSHIDLPADEWFVQPYVYIAYPPKRTLAAVDVLFESKDDKKMEYDNGSTDEELYEHAIAGRKSAESWLSAIRETSIECQVLAEMNKDTLRKCYTCQPNNQKLFSNNLYKDLKLGNNCRPFEVAEIDATVITIDDPDTEEPIEIFYSIDEKTDVISAFIFDDKLNGHKPISKKSAIYKQLVYVLDQKNKK